MRGVYLLHFDGPYKHAKHYVGYSKDIDARIEMHRQGQAARLTQVIKEHGIGFVVAKTWGRATRRFERQLKNRGGASRYCPICQAKLREERHDA